MSTNYLLMEGGGGTIGKFLNSVVSAMSSYGQIIVVIIGVAMVLVGIFQIAKNLISHGKGQTNWFVTIALIVVGGVFSLSGGWGLIGKFAQSSKESLGQMTEGKFSDTQDPESPWEGID